MLFVKKLVLVVFVIISYAIVTGTIYYFDFLAFNRGQYKYKCSTKKVPPEYPVVLVMSEPEIVVPTELKYLVSNENKSTFLISKQELLYLNNSVLRHVEILDNRNNSQHIYCTAYMRGGSKIVQSWYVAYKKSFKPLYYTEFNKDAKLIICGGYAIFIDAFLWGVIPLIFRRVNKHAIMTNISVD